MSVRAGVATRLAPRTTRAALKIGGSLHRLLYRISSGRLGSSRGGTVLLLTTTGRKTGRERTWPLSYLAASDELVLVASAAGAQNHPGWYLNLREYPQVRIELGDRIRPMIARTAEGIERARLWERLVQQYPILTGYQRKTDREMPVVVLSPGAA